MGVFFVVLACIVCASFFVPMRRLATRLQSGQSYVLGISFVFVFFLRPLEDDLILAALEMFYVGFVRGCRRRRHGDSDLVLVVAARAL